MIFFKCEGSDCGEAIKDEIIKDEIIKDEILGEKGRNVYKLLTNMRAPPSEDTIIKCDQELYNRFFNFMEDRINDNNTNMLTKAFTAEWGITPCNEFQNHANKDLFFNILKDRIKWGNLIRYGREYIRIQLIEKFDE